MNTRWLVASVITAAAVCLLLGRSTTLTVRTLDFTVTTSTAASTTIATGERCHPAPQPCASNCSCIYNDTDVGMSCCGNTFTTLHCHFREEIQFATDNSMLCSLRGCGPNSTCIVNNQRCTATCECDDEYITFDGTHCESERAAVHSNNFTTLQYQCAIPRHVSMAALVRRAQTAPSIALARRRGLATDARLVR